MAGRLGAGVLGYAIRGGVWVVGKEEKEERASRPGNAY